jgi:hypothetical protein
VSLSRRERRRCRRSERLPRDATRLVFTFDGAEQPKRREDTLCSGRVPAPRLPRLLLYHSGRCQAARRHRPARPSATHVARVGVRRLHVRCGWRDPLHRRRRRRAHSRGDTAVRTRNAATELLCLAAEGARRIVFVDHQPPRSERKSRPRPWPAAAPRGSVAGQVVGIGPPSPVPRAHVFSSSSLPVRSHAADGNSPHPIEMSIVISSA